MLEITSLGQLLSYVQRSDVVTVVDFYADWCGPCQQIKPQFEQMAQYYDSGKVIFAKCNVDRNRDCASRYGVATIPTFIVFHANERITTVTGGDLGTVERNIAIALALIPENTDMSSTSEPAATRGVAQEVQDAFAEQMLRIAEATRTKNAILEKDSCDAAYSLLRARTPYGLLLLPYLASDAFSPAAFGALLNNIASRAGVERYDGESLINQVLCHVIHIVTRLSWDDISIVQQLHSVLLSLLACPQAHAALVGSPFFMSEFLMTGSQLERSTLLGVFFGLGPSPMTMFSPSVHLLEVLGLFPPKEEGEDQAAVYTIQKQVMTLANMNVHLVNGLLRTKATRDATLRYLGRALQLNEDYLKTIHHDRPISSRFFMVQLQSVLIDLALPIFKLRAAKDDMIGSRGYDYSQIPSHYLLDRLHASRGTVVSFGSDVERVTHYDNDNPLPTPPSRCEAYKPFVHLFFLAARAVTLCAAVFIEEHETNSRQATHPQASLRQRAFYTADKHLLEGLLGSDELGASRLEFLSHLAHWLLGLMQVDDQGDLPAQPPAEWGYLPQCLVDCVIRSTSIAPLDAQYSGAMISLMLVLMGNTKYFPKPHTHALFAAYLLRLQENYETRKALEQHPWFSTHIVRASMECYITVEKSVYERVQVRYELSYALKTFLKSSLLCEPVRKEMELHASNTMLERFSHMAVAEVNEAVDQVIHTLTTMNEMVRAGADLSENAVASRSSGGAADRLAGRDPADGRLGDTTGGEGVNSDEEGEREENGDGSQTYHQLGLSLRSHLMLFTVSMDMFIELALQFPKGVSQNMVAGQISEMLARSLMAFAGPQSRNLKIQNAELYNFRPTEVLMRLVDCFTHFRSSQNFLRCLCRCSIAPSDICSVMNTIVQRELVSPDLFWKLSEMASAVSSVSKMVDGEEALWNDAPDFALDALLSTPLLQPVALPAEVKDLKDLVYINKETLHHLLLSDSKHPFTKEPLTEEQVALFNERPEVVSAVEERRAAIQKWLADAKAAKM